MSDARTRHRLVDTPRSANSRPQPHGAHPRMGVLNAEPEREDAGASGDPRRWPWVGASGARLAQGLVFGLIFGFLLQKGGVAKFDILIGVLLLEDFTVVQVMLSAIIVGMIGVYALSRMNAVELQVKETVLGANIIGGLMFGAGFGLIAYCPGTNAAAVGQGNLDAIIGVVGMAAGSYLFARGFRFTSGTVGRWGRRGHLTLPGITGLSAGTFIAVAVPVLIGVLILIGVAG